jgi:hypothetical protein
VRAGESEASDYAVRVLRPKGLALTARGRGAPEQTRTKVSRRLSLGLPGIRLNSRLLITASSAAHYLKKHDDLVPAGVELWGYDLESSAAERLR